MSLNLNEYKAVMSSHTLNDQIAFFRAKTLSFLTHKNLYLNDLKY